MARRLLLVALLACLCSPAVARAVPGNTIQVAILPTLSTTGELRWEHSLHPAFGALLLAGVGRSRDFSPDLDQARWLGEIGGQARVYLGGGFVDGVSLALEGRYLRLLDGRNGEQGLSGGLLMGYKYAQPIGFTTEVQVGGVGVYRWAEQVGTGQIVARDEFLPLVHLGAGWTF